MNINDNRHVKLFNSFLNRYKLFFFFVFTISIVLLMSAKFIVSWVCPLLILSCIFFFSYQSKSILTFIVVLLFVMGLFIMSLGGFYIIICILFGHVLPTFIVVVLTLLCIQIFFPLASFKNKIVYFILISSLIGLNTSLLKFIDPTFKVDETIGRPLVLHQKDQVQIANTKFPLRYSKFNFVSFYIVLNIFESGRDRWIVSTVSFDDMALMLQRKRIPNKMDEDIQNQKIDVSYNQINEDTYRLIIEIKEKDQILSTLQITDIFPFGRDVSKATLDTFSYRLKFLQSHNLWHLVLYFLPHHRNIDHIVENFLDKSIKMQEVEK